MNRGNITIHTKPDPEALLTNGICSNCLTECPEVPVDGSFYDAFGSVRSWGAGSRCCESKVYAGRIYLNSNSVHIARMNHVNRNGKTVVYKGQKYRKHVRKGFYIDGNGTHVGILEIRKYPLTN